MVLLLLSVTSAFVSCEEEGTATMPDTTIQVVGPLPCATIHSVVLDTTMVHYPGLYYPGFGDWDTTYFVTIDIDQDGMEDFRITANSDVTWFGTSTAYFDANTLKFSGDSLNLIATATPSCFRKFNPGEAVDSTSAYAAQTFFRVSVIGVAFTCPTPFQDQYIGFKLIRNAATYYGWINFVYGSYNLTLKSATYYACDQEPAIVTP